MHTTEIQEMRLLLADSKKSINGLMDHAEAAFDLRPSKDACRAIHDLSLAHNRLVHALEVMEAENSLASEDLEPVGELED